MPVTPSGCVGPRSGDATPSSPQSVLQRAAGHGGQLRGAPAGRRVVLLPLGAAGMPRRCGKKVKLGPELL